VNTNNMFELALDAITKPLQKPTRDGFGTGLIEAAQHNKNIVGLCADLLESTRMLEFQKQFPDRYIEMGVQEQNMAGVAAGLAQEGLIPFITSYATFSPGRNWDQVRVSICYNKANVKIIGAHAGISVGPDGATHQALEDIAITRVLPNLTVIAPCDTLETHRATIAAANMEGPVYIRFTREASPIVTTPQTAFEIGKAYVVKEGKDVAIISTGPQLYDALLASEMLSHENITCTVIHCPTIKPLDSQTILEATKDVRGIITIEEHQIAGGFGSAICELMSEKNPKKVIRIGMKDSFGESGKPKELLIKYGITIKELLDAAHSLTSH